MSDAISRFDDWLRSEFVQINTGLDQPLLEALGSRRPLLDLFLRELDSNGATP